MATRIDLYGSQQSAGWDRWETRAIPHLTALLEDGNWEEQDSARWALDRLEKSTGGSESVG